MDKNYQLKIAEILINIESIKFSFDKPFTLTSGLKSPVYVDCRKIISFVKEREFIMDAAVNYIEKNKLKFDLIAGGETAGIPYSAFISEKIKKPMIYIRKKPKGFGLFFEGRLVCFYDYESDLSDGWEDSSIHNNPQNIRLKALKMGSNIIEYAFKN